MDDETRKILERVLHISEQNNRVLRRIRREMLWARFMRLGYWLVIIIAGGAAYYFIQPYINGISSLYGSATDLQNFLPK